MIDEGHRRINESRQLSLLSESSLRAPDNTYAFSDSSRLLDAIRHLDNVLLSRFQGRFVYDTEIDRQEVSFQANKHLPVYRWFKFKEAFSATLVQSLLQRYGATHGELLDPFAGIGTTLFAASDLGLNADGIEIMPLGLEIIQNREQLHMMLTSEDLSRLQYWLEERPWRDSTESVPLNTLRITKAAFPEETITAVQKFLAAIQNENGNIRAALRTALLCILEVISYTRKDGQYLRWDYRSGRVQGKRSFNKGRIQDFNTAIQDKLNEIIVDLRSMEIEGQTRENPPGRVRLFHGSCLDILPMMAADTYNIIITSPPYCNRYDYTRTYALELALLGIGESDLVNLRQSMLSCTVENREKDLISIEPSWSSPLQLVASHELLNAILQHLEEERTRNRLNNNGIIRMVRGYFQELCCVIYECLRVLEPGGLLFMVNDNVRYAGASISVDLILSDLAEKLGFEVQQIIVLPKGKGNSSQQMGTHGREVLRKCIYVWRKS